MNDIIIPSSGRSGTNILLDCFDLSSKTICRNEAHFINTSLLYKISLLNINLVERFLDDNWDAILSQLKNVNSIRDRHHIKTYKKHAYYNSLVRTKLAKLIVKKRKVRSLLSIFFPKLSGLEYEMPKFLRDKSVNPDLTFVFKFPGLTNCMPWLSMEQRNIKFVHIIRYPLGYLSSLRNQHYLKYNNLNHFQYNKVRFFQLLDTVKKLELDLEIPSPENLSLFELDLWNWVMYNKILLKLLTHNRNAIIFTYEELLLNPVDTMSKAYEHCGLDFNSKVEKDIRFTFEDTKYKINSYKSLFSDIHKKQVDEILLKIGMIDFWSQEVLDTNMPNKKISKHNYIP